MQEQIEQLREFLKRGVPEIGEPGYTAHFNNQQYSIKSEDMIYPEVLRDQKSDRVLVRTNCPRETGDLYQNTQLIAPNVTLQNGAFALHNLIATVNDNTEQLILPTSAAEFFIGVLEKGYPIHQIRLFYCGHWRMFFVPRKDGLTEEQWTDLFNQDCDEILRHARYLCSDKVIRNPCGEMTGVDSGAIHLE